MPAFHQLEKTPAMSHGGFDKSARQLVSEYQERGWRGRVGTKGHAIMQSPDGTSTASIPSKLDSVPRGLQNARRPLDQWLRMRETEVAVETVAPVEPATSHAPSPEVFKCEVCGKEFDTLRKLKSHASQHVMVTCPDCGETFAQSGIGSHRYFRHGTGGKRRPEGREHVRTGRKVLPPRAEVVAAEPEVVPSAPEAPTPEPSIDSMLTSPTHEPESVAEKVLSMASEMRSVIDTLVAENAALRRQVADYKAWFELMPGRVE